MKQVNELLLEKAEVINQDASQQEIAKLMKEKNVRHIFILDNAKVKGLVSSTDILNRAVAEGKILDANKLMTKKLIFISPEKTAGQALAEMIKFNQYSLPVIKNERLYGIITLSSCLGGLQ